MDSKMKTPAFAVAYATQKAAKPKKMAQGGQVNPSLSQSRMEPIKKELYCSHGHPVDENYALGGMTTDPAAKAIQPSEHRMGGMQSVADMVMARRAKKMADGGMVGEDDEEPGNNFEELSEDAFENGDYDGDDIEAQPEDSNEHGDEDEKAKGTLVSRIMSKKSKKF